MTQPGYVAPAAPGWWVRTNRVGTNKTGVNWDITATGERDSLGSASGSYGWAGSANGQALNLQLIGANAAAASSVTIPPHLVGDLIVMAAYNVGGTLSPAAPAAGGTVPTWVDIDANTGANSNALHTVQFVATGTHTSGVWSTTDYMIAAVIRNPFSIGGHAETGSSGTASISPSITMTRSDGSSMLLDFHGHNTATAWDGAPAGYTRRAAIAATGGLCLNTKDNATSDGSVSQTLTGTSSGYRGATVEVLFH